MKIEAVDQKLRELELERGERIARSTETPEEQAEEQHIPGHLEGERTRGANWTKRERTGSLQDQPTATAD